MEQQSIDVIDFEREVRQAGVSKRDNVPQGGVLATAPTAPAPAAQLDITRKILVGLAGALTLLWFGFLAWGALRLIGMLFF